jgi:high-affinity iron transporter
MLATLVIGLREGLEASLIVGIIAAFLVRTGKPLRPMWVGVGSAILLSIAVGVGLQVVSADLPQAQQEGMETIIGFVAVVFVTGMIGWMNHHARHLRSELEQSAASALRDGTAWALVAMAFLAVLKEGFETSVFLLAAFQSSTSALAAGAGALIGIAIAIAIGVGIYRGGIRLNLSRFFRITGLFLVLVAAGLVLSALRTAHEAGWVLVGQQATVNLSWLAPNGSVQAALLTGVLGIPSDPRLIEVLGWFAYLVPVLLYLLWPASRRPSAEGKPRLLFGLAAGALLTAIALALAVSVPAAFDAGPARLVTASGGTAGSATLGRSGDDFSLNITTGKATVAHTFTLDETIPAQHDSVTARMWRQAATETTGPDTITLPDLITLAGGRIPIGIDASQNPGPFSAESQQRSTLTAWISGSTLLDTSFSSVNIVTLAGGGLAAPRTITVASPTASPSWSASAASVSKAASGVSSVASATAELLLWKLELPIILAVAALSLALSGLRARRRFRTQRARAGEAALFAAAKTAAAISAPQPSHV